MRRPSCPFPNEEKLRAFSKGGQASWPCYGKGCTCEKCPSGCVAQHTSTKHKLIQWLQISSLGPAANYQLGAGDRSTSPTFPTATSTRSNHAGPLQHQLCGGSRCGVWGCKLCRGYQGLQGGEGGARDAGSLYGTRINPRVFSIRS